MIQLQREPVVTAAVIQAFVVALLTALIAFNVPLTDPQKLAIVGVVEVVAPFVAAWYQRQHVTPMIDPRDDDGQPLTRADNSPSLRRQRAGWS